MGLVAEGEIVSDGVGYGMRLYLSDGTVIVQPDVDTTPQSVERLLSRLLGEEIDEEQLGYILHDHLVREYTVKQ